MTKCRQPCYFSPISIQISSQLLNLVIQLRNLLLRMGKVLLKIVDLSLGSCKSGFKFSTLSPAGIEISGQAIALVG